MSKNLRTAYKTIIDDPFPADLSITLGTKTLRFSKRTWKITGDDGSTVEKGLRYGENPNQPAALYELIEAEPVLDNVSMITPGAGLVGSLSEENLIQFGKHPGKINLTDIDSAVLPLRYFSDTPACAIMKHNNPCAVARGKTADEALEKAHMADPLASFGGCVVLNRPLSRSGAEYLSTIYIEVVACPDYEEGACEILNKRRNLRVVRLPRLRDLDDLKHARFLDIKSLTDGGMIVQLSSCNPIESPDDFLPAETEKNGDKVIPRRAPTDRELNDMFFGWAVEQGVTSNSVLFTKDDATVAIGAGGQDRVGVVKQAVMKAYDRYKDRLSLKRYNMLFFELELEVQRGGKDRSTVVDISEETAREKGGLRGSVLCSDAFFPRRDGVDLAIEAGVSAICQPGGSIRDYESIEAVNEAEPPVAMVFTGQRAFRH